MTQPDEPLEALTLEYAAAVGAKDPGRLAALYAADISVFDAWEDWSYDGMPAWRAVLDGWLGSLGDERVEVRFDEVRALASGDAGVLTATITFAAVDPAGVTLRSLQERLTWVLRRRADGWAITHQHTSFPVGGDLKAIMRKPVTP